ncbi:MAG: M1 family metallopeptidase, partial [Candidatus Aminicenantes bacterium]
EIKIKEIRQIGGGELTGNFQFISPDDNNPDDRTVMELKLEKPVPPGQILRLKIEFVLTIPQIFFRTGAEGDYFFMGQWFPKIGVLQDNGQWHCHQFHYNSEFFANYGTYRVWLTIPGEFVIGATGNLIKTEENADNTITYVFEEDNIHDFAWTAYPHFKKITETLQLKESNEAITIELLLAPGHGAAKHRYLNSLKFALDFYAQHIFPYPYKKITVVDPPLRGLKSAGMEYPTLITSGYIDMLPGSFKLTEIVTIHEFGHQYWYGIVGSDEFREAWLDEGVNSFFELEIMDEYFKDSNSLLDSPFIKINDWELSRIFYTYVPPLDPVNLYSWKFFSRSQYVANVYAKAAIFLRSLKNLVGKERMYNFFKYYAEKYKFKHSSTGDFIDAFNTFMNEDFSWAFDQFIHAGTNLDHAVHSVESVKIAAKPDKFRNEAIFVRKQGYFPVELVIALEGGKEIRSFWKEKENWKKIVFDDPCPIRYAAIDPHCRVPLDQNFLDNSKICKPSTSGIKRLSMQIGFFFQNLLGFL